MSLPNLASLNIAPTPTGMPAFTRGAQQKLMRSLPVEIWQKIFEEANNDPNYWDTKCDETVKRCLVGENAPWAQERDAQGRTACGPDGWVYDQANEMRGSYRGGNGATNWAELQQWVQANPQELVAEVRPDGGTYPGWWTCPRAYFLTVCRASENIKRQGANFSLYSFIRAPGRSKPWMTALILEYLIKNPQRMVDVPPTDRDYAHFATIILLLAPWYLSYVPGTVTWPLGNVATFTGPHPSPLSHHDFQTLCKSGTWADGMMIRYVPGSLNADRTAQSAAPIPEYAEIAKHAVDRTPQALRFVPGSNAVDGGPQAGVRLPEYVEIAKIAVKKTPALLRFVPGAEIPVGPNGTAWTGPPQVANWVQTPPNGITDEEFREIAKEAVLAADGNQRAPVFRMVPQPFRAAVAAAVAAARAAAAAASAAASSST